MSTLAYAQFTTAREESPPGTSTRTQPPGTKTYVDALSALVPAEVLTLHAVILPATTTVKDGATTISAPETLQWAFLGLLLLAVGLYVGPRLIAGKWDRLDWLRAAIPPAALVGWTMLQRTTAFDAVFPDFHEAPRTVIALFLGVVLGLVAGALAYQADRKAPSG